MTSAGRRARPAAWAARRVPSLAAFVAFVALATATLAPAPLHAQLGGALGFRVAGSNDPSGVNGERTGYEARLLYDRALTSPRWSLRGEFAYNQMQYLRTDGADRFKVSENGFEIVASMRAELGDLLTGLYLTGGPVASFRAACGSSGFFDSNGRVACAEGETYLTGYALAVGYSWPGERNDFFVEVRTLGNVTAAAGQNLLGVSVGVRKRR